MFELNIVVYPHIIQKIDDYGRVDGLPGKWIWMPFVHPQHYVNIKFRLSLECIPAAFKSVIAVELSHKIKISLSTFIIWYLW